MSRFESAVYVTRKTTFCASHRYHNPDWSDEENRRVFGACNNPYGHGHNYEVEVTVCGPIDRETGMVLNLRELDDLLEKEVVSRFDHRYINKEVSEFETTIPTTENIALHIWDRLEPALRRRRSRLHRVRLYESADFYVEYLGEGTVE